MIDCPVGPVVYTPNSQPSTAAEIVWPVDNCCDEKVLVNDVEVDALVTRPELVQAAVEILHESTCRRFGVCSIISSPCISNCACGTSVCSGCTLKRFDLRDITSHPILDVEEIKIGAAVVPSTDYWLSGSRWLIPRRDGLLWSCPPQDLNAAPESDGTWQIKMKIGEPPPAAVLLAAADLACQLYKFCTNKPCDLPPNAVSVIRDGTTIRLLTGIEAVPTVKMALDVWGKCHKKKKRSRMVHPADVMLHTTSVG